MYIRREMALLDNFKSIFKSEYVYKNDNGITISFNDMNNSLSSLGELFDNVYANIASDLANADVITTNKEVYTKWNLRANDVENSQTFQEDMYFHLMKYGIVFVDKQQMHVFQNITKSDFEIDSKRKTIKFLRSPYEKLTYGINELYIIKLPNKFNTETLNRTIATKYLTLLDSIQNASRYNLLVKLNSKLQKDDIEALRDTLISASETGTIIADNKIESVTELKGGNTFNKDLYDFLTAEIYAYFGYTYNLKTLNYTNEEYQHYHFSTLMPILRQVKQEITYKEKVEVYVVHRSLFITPDSLKLYGMLGTVTPNQVMMPLGMPPSPNGDMLIQNWNDTSKGGEDGKDTK